VSGFDIWAARRERDLGRIASLLKPESYKYWRGDVSKKGPLWLSRHPGISEAGGVLLIRDTIIDRIE
jgi:hypothetical protein